MCDRLFSILLCAIFAVPSATSAQDVGTRESDTSTGGAVCSTDHQLDFVAYAEDYLEEGVQGRAVEVLTNGCERGDVASCRRLADLYASGTGVKTDADRAEQLRQRALELRE